MTEADHYKKLGWARKHLDALNDEIDEWCYRNPLTPRVHIDRGLKRVTVSVWTVGVLPPHWPLMIGDIAHNMRSAIDHLFYALCSRGRASKSSLQERRRIQFPICSSPGEYWGGKGNEGQRARRCKFAPPLALPVVDALQPWQWANGPELHPLAILSGLSNEDKHRSIVLTAILGQVPLMSFGGVGVVSPERATIVHAANRRLEPGALLVTAQFLDQGPWPWNVYVDAHLVGDVAFDESGPGRGQAVRQSLDRVHSFIRDEVFGGLDPFVR